jgi:hypothetical protein
MKKKRKLTLKQKVAILRQACEIALGVRGRYCELDGFEVTELRNALRITK